MKKLITLLLCCVLLCSTVGCKKDNESVTITYLTEGNGSLVGEASQTIPMGNDGSTVTAVAGEGWMFVGWDDGYKKPTRTEKGVTTSVTYTAIFVSVGDEGDEEEDTGDNPDDIPSFGFDTELDGAE